MVDFEVSLAESDLTIPRIKPVKDRTRKIVAGIFLRPKSCRGRSK